MSDDGYGGGGGYDDYDRSGCVACNLRPLDVVLSSSLDSMAEILSYVQ